MFKATPDKPAQYIPLAMVAFGLLMAFIGTLQGQRELLMVYALPGLILLCVLIGCWYYAPLGYEVTARELRVKRRAGDWILPRSAIRSVKKLQQSELGPAWRMAGNGGVFGYTGYYSSSSIGRMRWFVTRRGNYILIGREKGVSVLLSPDDPDALLTALR